MRHRTWVRVVVASAVVVVLMLVATEAGYASHIFGRASSIRRVVIDPGHGGKDPGTMHGAEEEKNIVLSVGRQVAGDLGGQGVRATLTRSTDRFVELNDRAAIGNRLGAALFVSIHADSNPDPLRHGFTIYTAPHAGSRTMADARTIERSLASAGFHSLGIQQRRLRVLVESRGPALLIELGFLSNAAEAATLRQPGTQSRYAQAIAAGIQRALDGP